MILSILDDSIHFTYFLMAGGVLLLLLRCLFFRKSRRSIVYDIVYAYTIIPFLLRVLHIK